MKKLKNINWRSDKDIKSSSINGNLCILLISFIIIIIINITTVFATNEEIIEYSNINTSSVSEKLGSNFKIEILENNEFSYYIKVNIKTQTVTVYIPDEKGEYTIPIKSMICSTGTATPEGGVYKISDKFRWAYLNGGVYGQYATRIVGSILFHSVPYLENDNSTLEYWEYDKLGQPVSQGCVRLTVEDAKWIYENCTEDVQVEFYYDDTESLLPIKQPQKISNYTEELRNWDPTDPNTSNPWIKYKNQNKGDSE